MKSPIVFTLFLLNSVAFAQAGTEPKVLPTLPETCAEQIEANGIFCSGIVTQSSSIEVTFIGIVSKASFPTADVLMGRYLDFESWPTYVDTSPLDVVSYKVGGSTALPVMEGADGIAIYPQTFDYDLKVQGIPFLKQNVRGVTYNRVVSPYLGAAKSIEFEAQKGPLPEFPEKLKGMKAQTGSVHVLECSGLDFCDDSAWMVIFQTSIQPDVSFAMGIAGKTVKAGIEDILMGMLEE